MKKQRINQSISDIVGNIVASLFGGRKVIKDLMKDPQVQKKIKDVYRDLQKLQSAGKKILDNIKD